MSSSRELIATLRNLMEVLDELLYKEYPTLLISKRNLKANKIKTREIEGGNLMQASPIEVQKSLKDIDYPVKKKELIHHATKHGASNKVIEVLESLPDKEYTNAVDVSKEFKGK
jgi:hypothetical protein